MKNDLDELFKTHYEAVMAILNDNEFVGDCMDEIEAALDNLKNGIGDHVCKEENEDEPEITLDAVLNFIEGDDGDTYPEIIEAIQEKGGYFIVARNMNEQTRIEKFIEELNERPYTEQ